MSDKLAFGIKIPKQVWSGSEAKQTENSGSQPKTSSSVRSLIGKMGGRGNESPRGEKTENRVSPRNPEMASPRSYDVTSPRQDLSSPRSDSPLREPTTNFRATMGRSETANPIKSPRTKGIEKALTDAPTHKDSLPMRRVLVRENTDERKGPPNKSMTVSGPMSSPRSDSPLANSQETPSEFTLSPRHPIKAWPPQPGTNMRSPQPNISPTVSGDYQFSNENSAEMDHLQKMLPQLSPYALPRNRKTIPIKVEKARHHVIDFTLPDSEEYITFSDENKRIVKTACFSKIIEKMTANVPLIGMPIISISN